MYCSRCGLCCEETEMLLSNADIRRLERMGHKRQKFVLYDSHGFARLRNRHGFCVFYSISEHRCKIYENRPEGCRIYPIAYSEQEGIVVDHLCPMRDTVSSMELRRKGEKVMVLLHTIDSETASRCEALSESVCRRRLRGQAGLQEKGRGA